MSAPPDISIWRSVIISITLFDMKLLNLNRFTKALLVAAFIELISPMNFAGETKSSSLGNVVLPRINTPKDAQQCVEPTDVMRRDHMKFLFHQRDETVLNGVRTEKYSLTGCINCHAQTADDGKIVRADDPEYFCTTCHEYTSVKIDCFECHSDRPVAGADQLSHKFKTRLLLAQADSPKSVRDRIHKKLMQQAGIRVD